MKLIEPPRLSRRTDPSRTNRAPGVFCSLLLAFLTAAAPEPARAHPGELHTLSTDMLTIHASRGVGDAARTVAGLYPATVRKVQSRVGLPVDFRVEVVLLGDRRDFEAAGGDRLMVAYAVPAGLLVVIDYPRARADPFGVEGILAHELCHLVLHRHIRHLPRWLDEGVCQWASEGIAELSVRKGMPTLSWLALTGGLPPLGRLEKDFPQDVAGIELAYAMSRNLADFIAQRNGRRAIPALLAFMASGMPLDDACRAALGTSMHRLEQEWRGSLTGVTTVLGLAASELPAIVFFLGALGSAVAYARYRARRRRLADEGEDPETPGAPKG